MKSIILFVLAFCMSFHLSAQESLIRHAEQDTCTHLDEVVVTGVTGSASKREIAAPISIVSNASLRTHQSTNIIDAISRQPGISQISTGSGISKPVIRGLGYNRVLVVSDGIRQEGQQWGDEHGIEIDGQAVHSVEILKGPASLMYGSDAMAGVIIMRDAPIMPLGEQYAEAATEYQTNNGLAAYTLNYRGNHQGWIWNGRWSQRAVHDYEAPEDGRIANSRFHEQAASALLGTNQTWGHSHLKLSYYHLTPGMTEVEDDYKEGSRSYSIEAPFQQVSHYKIVWDNNIRLGEGHLKALIGYQQNRRQEYEEEDECGLNFRLHSAHYEVRYISPQWAGWKTNIGISGMYQQSDNLGDEYLIPAYTLNDAGCFITASRSFADQWHLSGGLRYDNRQLHSKALEDEGTIRFEDFSRSFSAASGSLGLIYNVNERLDLKANISHGYRAPNMSELGSNGVHEGTFRYEQGNASLDPERSWQFDLGLDYAGTWFSAAIALFGNRIEDYIYLQRTPVKIDEVPVYQFTAGEARILGGEARLIIHLLHHLHFENNLSIVDSRRMHADADNRYLPFTPAPRWLSTLHYDIPTRTCCMRNLFAEVEADINFRQDHVMTANDTETPTSAYTLWSLNIGTDLHNKKGRRLCTLSLSGTNLLDIAYQSHLSRLKYAETLPVTGRSGLNNMGRNITFRLQFPLSLITE